jgi:two-component system, OmpR family, phosphate regulon sensor histidine kinase PhoR
MRLTIAVKSVATVVLLIAASLAVVGFYLERREREAVIEEVVGRLEAQASLLSTDLPQGAGLGDAWAGQAAARTKARVTVVAPDGRVLADSEEPSARLENHRDRPEIAAALQAGHGQDIRFSRSVHHDLFYYAHRAQSAGGPLVLRLSVPLGDVSRAFSRFRRDFVPIALASFGLASLIAVLWARGFARRLQAMVAFVRAVSQRHPASNLPRGAQDELGDLAEALNAMAADLHGVVQRLEEESRRSRTILTNLGEALLVLDGKERITLLNPAAEKLFGLSPLPQIGHTLLEAVRSHELDDLLKTAYRRQDGAARAEITLLHPRRRTLSGTAAVIRDAYGGVQGTVLAFRDITELKRLEEMRMEFVLNVSHELRTPLTAIRGYAETLLDAGGGDPGTARKFLEIIHRHSERLARLLDDLLDLSNIELERAPLDLRPVAAIEVVRQALALLEAKAEQKAVGLAAAIPADLPLVLADRDRLVQILVNLVDNAVKYTPEGGKVAVTAHEVPWPSAALPADTEGSEPSSHLPASGVEIVVSDTGIGIPAKDLPRLTERFYRVDRARSRELGGTGLGLAIVNHLVSAHQGHLAIESRLGEGTRVRVVLRISSPSPSPDPSISNG